MEPLTLIIVIISILFICILIGLIGYYMGFFTKSSATSSTTPSTTSSTTPSTTSSTTSSTTPSDPNLCTVCISNYILDKTINKCINKKEILNEEQRNKCLSNKKINTIIVNNKCEIAPNNDGTCLYNIPLEIKDISITTDYLELDNNVCRPKPKIQNKICNNDNHILDIDGKCNYTPVCKFGTFENGKCIDNPINNKCSFNTYNSATGKCDLPPKKNPNGTGCISDIGFINIDSNSYTYDGDNCIINPFANSPSCTFFRDNKFDQVNPSTNTCQYDGNCPTVYIPDTILNLIKQIGNN
jgi:hypothetical protein